MENEVSEFYEATAAKRMAERDGSAYCGRRIETKAILHRSRR